MSKPVKSPPQFPPSWRVFPIEAGTKVPISELGDGWQHYATDDPAQIAAWAKRFPSCNWAVACGSSGLGVVDIDPPIGEDSLFQFELEHEQLPATREHQSARGGRHLIFSDPERRLKNTASKLGPKIDTRGGGDNKDGYILIPPSTFDDKPYTVTQDIPLAPLPQFVADAAGPKHEPKQAAPGTVLDAPANKARAKAYLKGLIEASDVAIEGSGGDARTFALIVEIMDRFALSSEGALEVIEEWNAHCEPPWDYDQLQVKADNASRYAQNEPGASAVPLVYDRIAPEALDKLFAQAAAAKEAPKSGNENLPAPMHVRDLRNIIEPDASFLIDGAVLARHVNILGGDGGSGKSTLARQRAVRIASELSMPVLLVNFEDGTAITLKSLDKNCAALGLTLDDLPIEVWNLVGQDALLATVHDNGTWEPGPLLPPLVKKLISYGQEITLILDNVADLVALDETKRAPVNTFNKKILGGLCQNFGTTILLITHPSKAAMQDGSGYAGSTAWRNSVRFMENLEWPNEAKTGNRRILKVIKSNYSDVGEAELFLIDGRFLPRDAQAPAELDARHAKACVDAALAAADQGMPIQTQRKPPKWVFDEIERDSGRRPTRRELFETLDYASRAGRIRYLKGTTKRMAGFYPWDETRAGELAAEAKRHATEVEALSTKAKKEGTGND